MKKIKTLPEIPSKLIRLALKDLKKVEKDEKYEIDMNYYYEFNNEKCSVCLAGAVMVKNLGASELKGSISTYDFGLINHKCLYALNEFRRGNFKEAFGYLNLLDEYEKVANKLEREIPEYEGEGINFKKAMYELADDLEKEGL